MKPSTSDALRPASSRQALMHSRCSECVDASGRFPTLVSATPTMAYLPDMLLMIPPGLNWSDGVVKCWGWERIISPSLQHSIVPVFSYSVVESFSRSAGEIFDE